MIEGYSEEFKSKYSELIHTVDTIQENLTPVRLRLYICILKYEVWLYLWDKHLSFNLNFLILFLNTWNKIVYNIACWLNIKYKSQ